MVEKNTACTTDKVIAGAAIGAGVAFIALGVKKVFTARRMKNVTTDPEDVRQEFEDYLAEKERKQVAKRKKKFRKGIFNIIVGVASAAVGAVFLSPYKKYLTDNRVVVKVKDADVIGKIKDSNVVGKFREADVIGKIKDVDVIGKIKDTDLAGKLRDADVVGRIKDNEFFGKIKGKLDKE